MKLLGLKRDEVSEAIQDGKVTIAVYGLGKMGLPLAAVFADHGANVIGVDINEKVVKSINQGENHVKEEPDLDEIIRKNVKFGRLKATTDGVEAAKQADAMIILVPTLIDERGNLKLEPVYDVARKISQGLKEGNVVITEATMPPGTTERLIPILEESGLKLGQFGLAHAPERTMTGTAIRDITRQYPKILGANDAKTMEAVIGIYRTINQKGIIPMSSIKAAEAVKVFEGIYRDVNIALANELALWCEEHGLDALEVFQAANTQPYCHIHMPGAGVGGHCIPVYPWFVINQARKSNIQLIRTARKINDSMPHHVVELTIKGLNQIGRPLKGSHILILGLTFRGGVREFTKSAAKPIIQELKEWGANVYAYDPLCSPEDAERFGAKWKEDFKGMDAIIITADHKEFKRLDFKMMASTMRGRVIVDGRNILNVDEDAKELGFVYLRVGYTDGTRRLFPMYKDTAS